MVSRRERDFGGGGGESKPREVVGSSESTKSLARLIAASRRTISFMKMERTPSSREGVFCGTFPYVAMVCVSFVFCYGVKG